MPANYEMTSVCFSIAKVQCQKLYIIGYFLSLSLIYPCMICLTKENMQRKIKSKKNQNAFYMITSMSSKRCESYRMYLKGDSPHQVVIIVCELNWFSHISNFHNMRHLCNLVKFFTHNTQYSLLLLIHVQVQCDLAITRNTCVNVCSLNCLNLILKYKIG